MRNNLSKVMANKAVKCGAVCSSLVLMPLVNAQEVSAQEVAKPSVDSIQKIGELKVQKEANGPSDQTDRKENSLSDQTAQKKRISTVDQTIKTKKVKESTYKEKDVKNKQELKALKEIDKEKLTGLFLNLYSNESHLIGDDYPSDWGYEGSDPWGYGKRWCTSFVAYRLHHINHFEMPRAIGYANNWGYAARNLGYRVDKTPAVGAVAWFDVGPYTPAGHVAWVAGIDGNYVTIEEYNWKGSRAYHCRRWPISGISGFIHFKDLENNGNEYSGEGNSGNSEHSNDSTELPEKGTYYFTSRKEVRGEPSLSSPELAYYDNGMSVYYDKTLKAEGYQWISYIGGSGNRRYIAIDKLNQSEDNPSNPHSGSSAEELPSKGTYYFTSRKEVRGEPSLSSPELAYYDNGMSVYYDKVLKSEGYQWISYIGGSGNRRYIAISPL